MPQPRLFVSSTYYDLKVVRADLDILEQELGVKVIRFESGRIPYLVADTLPEACCKEIDSCHILVSIIGSRRGSLVKTGMPMPVTTRGVEDSEESAPEEREISISRLEVERAIKSNLLLFTFVEADVLAEHRTYRNNTPIANKIDWVSVDSTDIFEFISHIYSLPGRNPIFSFRISSEIRQVLRDQLAGLFCDLLNQERLATYASHIDQVIGSAEKLESLQARVREKEREAENRMKEMLLPDSRIFVAIQQALKLHIRIFFKSQDELAHLLELVGYTPVKPREIDESRRSKMRFFRSEHAQEDVRYVGIPSRLFNKSGEIRPSVAVEEEDNVWVGPRV